MCNEKMPSNGQVLFPTFRRKIVSIRSEINGSTVLMREQRCELRNVKSSIYILHSGERTTGGEYF